MGFEAQFNKMLPHTVTLTAPTGRNAQGRPTYVGGTPKSYPSRVVGAINSLRTQQSASDSQEFIVYVNCGTDVITSEYQLNLPSDPMFLGSPIPAIYSVERLTDQKGSHHAKLICGYGFHHQTKL